MAKVNNGATMPQTWMDWMTTGIDNAGRIVAHVKEIPYHLIDTHKAP